MDKVRVSSNGGVSALSAFFTGYGSSVALDLPLEITMAVSDSKDEVDKGAISSTIDLLRERFGVSESFHVSVARAIPRGRGLKSSSALTLSIILGFLKINNIKLSDSEILNLGAELSILNGTSSTGAYDDLCSSYYGGVCFTDNRQRRLIFRKEVEEKPVIVAFNKARRESASVDLEEMSKFSRHGEKIQDLVRAGKYCEAMTLNGNLLGYVYGQNSDLIRYFLSSGAAYAGQCGKGPAVFAVFDNTDELPNAEKGLEKFFAVRHVKSEFSNKGITIESL